MHQRFTSVVYVSLLTFAGMANAATITYNATGGTAGTATATSASAVFTTSAGQITVVLSNTLAASAFRDVGEAVSDLSFTLSSPVGTVGTTTASGQQGTISGANPPSGGVTVAYTGGSPGRFIGVGGGAFSASGSSVLLEAIGGGKPTELIAPLVANGGAYSTGNNGLQDHNDYTIGPATFVLNLSGITGSTTVTGATFSFGTGPDTFVPGTPGTPPPPPAVSPEPSSLLLMGTGVFGAAGLLRRRYNK